MATLTKRLPSNTPGDFYVDETCIDCGACRWIAPTVFDREGDYSRVHNQPAGQDETETALRALLACPTASIGTESKQELRPVIDSIPNEVMPGVHFCGYTSEKSFGAASWLIRRPDGNVLIDSPRYVKRLADQIEALGGVRYMFLTHKDDVADHEQFAKRFGCQRIMHRDDIGPSTESVEVKLEGNELHRLADDLLVIPTPGHTRGSACLLWGEEALFTGDHLAFSLGLGHLYAFARACWYSWSELRRSMERLATYRFRAVLPGHGAPLIATHQEVAEQMQVCLDWMQDQVPRNA